AYVFPLAARFQHDQSASEIAGRVRSSDTRRNVEVVHGWILEHDIRDLSRTLRHGAEGNIRRTFRHDVEKTGVLDRKESFRNGDVQANGADQGADHDQKGCEKVFKHKIEARLVAAQALLEQGFERAKHDVLAVALVVALEHARAQHGGESERNKSRNQN